MLFCLFERHTPANNEVVFTWIFTGSHRGQIRLHIRREKVVCKHANKTANGSPTSRELEARKREREAKQLGLATQPPNLPIQAENKSCVNGGVHARTKKMYINNKANKQ